MPLHSNIFYVNKSLIPRHWLYISLKISGIFPIYEENLNNFQKCLNMLYFLLVDLLLINYIIGAAGWFLKKWDGEVESGSVVACNFAGYIVDLLGTIYIQVYNERLNYLLNVINDDFKYCSHRGRTVLCLNPTLVFIKRFYLVLLCGTFAGSVLWWLEPLFTTGDRTKQLPFEVWYPFDVLDYPLFPLYYFLQVISHTLFSLYFININGGLFSAGAILLVGQIDVICCNIRNAPYIALLSNGFSYLDLPPLDQDDLHYEQKMYFGATPKPIYFEINDVEESENSFSSGMAYDEGCLLVLADCIRHHQLVLRFAADFNNFFSPILFFQATGIVLFIGFSLLSVSTALTTQAIQYGILGFLYHFIICYAGNQVQIESGLVREAVWSMPWCECSLRVRRLLLHLQTQQNTSPMTLTGGYFTLDLENFISVVKSSFSFFTLLRGDE